MSRRENVIGRAYGKLTVVEEVEGRKSTCRVVHRRVLCKCECGNESIVYLCNLRRGHTTTCGCAHSEMLVKRNFKHGMARTRPYSVWSRMMSRCQNESSPDYKDYGGRGITVSDRWQSFENFWGDMQSSYSDSLSIDRINNSKGYSKENCRWATDYQQANNKRNSHLLTFQGETLTVAQWSRKVGIKYHTLLARVLYYNWPTERALTVAT